MAAAPAPILTVTANPAIDRYLTIPNLTPGAIHRAPDVLRLPGGKGLNVARTVRRLAGRVEACILAGGHSGRWVVGQLERAGIVTGVAWAGHETRANTVIYDPLSGLLTEAYEVGEPVDAAAWARFERLFERMVAGKSLVTFSGSLPPGAPDDGYARLIAAAHRHGARVLLDTAGEALAAALDARPALVKVNQAEASGLLGRPVEAGDVWAATAALLELGAEVGIVTLGAAGLAAARRDGARWRVAAPPVDAPVAVGSGDALLGGLATALWRGLPLVGALRYGAAAGAANAATLGGGLVERAAVDALAPRVEVTPASD